MTPGLGEVGLPRWRVLLVDENDDFLDGLTSWLMKTPGLDMIGRAHSGSEAMDRVERFDPQLILMDISLPDMNGFEVTRRIRARGPSPLVLLMTFHESRAAALAASDAGADGCVSKAEITDRLLPAVQELIRRHPAPGLPAREAKARGTGRTGRSRIEP